MNRLKITLSACFIIMQLSIVNAQLKGYKYVNEAAPAGNEWESPQYMALNKEQPRAWFFSFQSTEAARKLLPEHSAYWKSLNGEWKFHFAKNPNERPKDFYKPDFDVKGWDNIPVPSNWNIYGIQKDGSLKYGVPVYVNQPVIFQHKVEAGDWRGGVMRTPPASWTTYEYRNEVGSFRRDFEVPRNWDGRNVFISFDGTDSFFYLWINGRYVGFSKNSRNVAAFNITPYLKKGKNVLAVEVYRSSDGSFLEAQDMFRLPGIFRTVALYSTPQIHIRDLVVTPELDNQYKNGKLSISTDVRNLGSKAANGYRLVYSLYENKLYTDENTQVSNAMATAVIPAIKSKEETTAKAVLTMNAPKHWSAEFPHRYILVAELKDAKGKTVETVSTVTGFRQVEVKDTKAADDEFNLAGRYFYVNGKTVKLKGVNRHETNPAVGHAITREQMEEEVMLMKRANINHVRNSHYPDDPYWYYLCNKYGIYLEDEANIESHEYYYGEASLSHPPEWENAHVARVMEMVRANINNPSIVIWSLGNEAGPGKNFVAAYNALKKADVSRPVQYERNNDIVDIGSNQYPSIAWMHGAVTGKYNIKYPFHVSEYAHSMGNACGNLADYWEAMESTNFFMGGAIWDWVDQAMYNYDKKNGTRYLAYGGDFGDTPNDGQFVMNGIVFADLEPKPQYYEVKKVYQHIGAELLNAEKGEVEIFNKYYFKDLSDYDIKWSLYENGAEIQNGILPLPVLQPRDTVKTTIPYRYAGLKNDAEYFVKLQFMLKENKPWAEKSFVEAEEQFWVKEATAKPSIAVVADVSDKLSISEEKNITTVKGNNFSIQFDLNTGSIYTLSYGNERIIEAGNGPQLNAIRAFVNNDNWVYEQWFEHGLHNLKHKAVNNSIIQKADGTVVVSFAVESQAPNAAKIHGGTSSGRNTIEELTDKKFGENDFKFITHQVWTIYRDGSVELQSSIVSNQDNLVLPRLGYMMKIPEKYSNFNYYGRGPVDNYPDRKTGQFIQAYKSTVKDQFVNFPKPQDMGNHEDVRWAALTDNAGRGAVFIATQKLSVSALPYTPVELILAAHPYQLPQAGDTYLYLDLGVTGLGGNSCGQGAPLVQDRINAGPHTMGFIIRPAEKDLAKTANISAAGDVPVGINRDVTGEVTISPARNNGTIMYSINNGKEITYKVPFQLREGGNVTAWVDQTPEIKTSLQFAKIERIKTTVVAASSQEAGGGEATNLTDGDANTIWHTMYSVTVAKYPHWVDLDAGEMKMIKGFTFLPRPGGGNGNVKDYTIQVSTDGKTWSKPVVKSSFSHTAEEKKILFARPVKARYIRFTALSEQRGQDFASAAEIGILAD